MKKQVKQISVSAIVAVVLCFLIGIVSFAATKAFYYQIDSSGQESNSTQFVFLTDRTRLDEGVGLVWGDGKLPDYESKVVRPWAGDNAAMGIYKLVIDDPKREGRITRIGDHFFEGMYNLTEVTMYPYVKTISKTAFKDVNQGKGFTINFQGTRSQWETIMYNSAMSLPKDLPNVKVKCTDGSVIPESIGSTNCFVNIERDSYEYTGSQIRPAVHVFYNGKELTENKDYTVSYGPNKDGGSGYVRVDGKGSFTGQKSVAFKITPVTKTVTLSASKDKLRVGETLVINANAGVSNLYKLQISNESIAKGSSYSAVKALKCGEVTVKAIPINKNNCTIKSNTLKLTIVPALTSSFSSYSKDGYIYLKWKKVDSADGYYLYRDNKKIKTFKKNTVTDYKDKKAKKNGHRYKYQLIAYSNTTGFLRGKSLSAYFLSKPKITKLKQSKNKIYVKWKKNTECTGYQIKYSVDNFKLDNRTREIYNKNKPKYTISASKGRKLKVKVRSFYLKGGSIYYSAWSSTKSIWMK